MAKKYFFVLAYQLLGLLLVFPSVCYASFNLNTFILTITSRLLPLVVKASFLFMGIVSCLVIILIFVKIFTIIWNKDVSLIRKRLAPHFENYMDDPSGKIPKTLQNLTWPSNKMLQYIIIHRSFGKSGKELKKISFAYEKLGFVKTDLKRLSSLFWWVRAEGARCLGQIKAQTVKKQLFEKLKDSVLEVRLIAAWSLGRIGEPDIIKPVLESLVSTSRLAGMRLSSTVFELGDKAIPPLLESINHPDNSIQTLALHLLAELKNPSVIPQVINKTAATNNLEVRLSAFKALGTLENTAAEETLINSLYDPIWQIRAQAARSLGLIKSTNSIPKLTEALKDLKWWVRRNAGEALIKLGKNGEKALHKAQKESPDEPSGKMAAQWLDELKSVS